MAVLPKILEFFTLTEMVNEFKNPNSFLTNMIFGTTVDLRTENIIYRIQRKGRKIAGFTHPRGEAIFAGGYQEEEVQFTAPNIRIKHPLDAADLIFRRHAGDVIFVGGNTPQQEAEREIALQLQAMDDEVSNSIEWLAGQSIRGVINYSVEDEASFTIDMKKPAANTIDLGVGGNYWNTAGSTELLDIQRVKRRMHDEVTLNPMICVMGSVAADSFLASTEIQRLLDIRNMRVGLVDGTADINELGAQPLGGFGGIDFWAYTREVEVEGVSEPLVRPNYAEFINTSPQAQHVLYYAAHADLDALDGGLLAAARFSKSWRQQDPSVQQLLLASRPLPVLRRPGSVVSLQVAP